MANSITVNSGTVKTKAGELKTLNAGFRKQVESLRTTEGVLNAMWEGEAKTEFHQAFTKDISAMMSFYSAIEKYVQSLEQIAQTYEAAERKNAGIAGKRSF